MAQTEERTTKNRVAVPLVFVITFLTIGVTAIILQVRSGQFSGSYGTLFHIAILIWAVIYAVYTVYDNSTNGGKKVQPRWRGMFINLLLIAVLLCCVTFIISGPYQNQVITDSKGVTLDSGTSSRFGISTIDPFTEELHSYPDEFTRKFWWGADTAYVLYRVTEDGTTMYHNWGTPARMMDSIWTLFSSVLRECYEAHYENDGWRVVTNKTFDNLPDMPGIQPVDAITQRAKNVF